MHLICPRFSQQGLYVHGVSAGDGSVIEQERVLGRGGSQQASKAIKNQG
jgi:hypothetical protein